MYSALEKYDPQLFELIKQEEARQSGVLRLIPSENYVSQAVRMATGSCLTNKYSEGYPGKRYYEGQQVTDLVENVARKRAKKIFKADHANVQPYSGSVANLGAYNALIKPGQKIMGLTLGSGGHLTHGSKVSITSKFFKAVNYSVNENGYLDYDEIRDMAIAEKPDIIVSGTTAYPRAIDFEIFGEQLPADALNEAFNEAAKSDLMLVLGSSLVVQPAASIPVETARAGGRIVIVNNMPTPLDGYAWKHFTELESFSLDIINAFNDD